jgi:hypothetical protein
MKPAIKIQQHDDEEVMLDLETLGTKPGCPVLSIGAVFFSKQTGKLGAEFYCVIYSKDQTARGLIASADTIAWWKKQSAEARTVISLAGKLATSTRMPAALEAFTTFLESSKSGMRNVKVWGNGSDFDQPILSKCFDAVGMEQPWEFRNNRCFRTMKAMLPKPANAAKRIGVYHNALDDAKTQAAYLLEALKASVGKGL